MLQELVGRNVHREYSRLDALINVTLTEGWRQYNNARETVLRETIDAIVVAFVVHPKIIFLQEVTLSFTLLPRDHAEKNWRVVQDHVQTQLINCSEKPLKVVVANIILKFLHSTFSERHDFLTLFHILICQKFIDLGVRILKNFETVFLE